MYQIKLSLNTGLYEGVSFLEEAPDELKLQEFIDGIIVTDVERQDSHYHCTCMSPMYSGPLLYIDVPSMPLDMQGVHISDIEQLSDYVKEHVRQNNILSINTDKNTEVSFF